MTVIAMIVEALVFVAPAFCRRVINTRGMTGLPRPLKSAQYFFGIRSEVQPTGSRFHLVGLPRPRVSFLLRDLEAMRPQVPVHVDVAVGRATGVACEVISNVEPSAAESASGLCPVLFFFRKVARHAGSPASPGPLSTLDPRRGPARPSQFRAAVLCTRLEGLANYSRQRNVLIEHCSIERTSIWNIRRYLASFPPGP